MPRTILSLIISIGTSVSSLAAPPNNVDPALATWFRSLWAPIGSGCCDVADCRRASSRMTRAGYEVMIDGQWTLVPWERVLQRSAKQWFVIHQQKLRRSFFALLARPISDNISRSTLTKETEEKCAYC